MTKTLVTGATGCFGRAVARALAQAGHVVTCAVRSRPGHPAADRAAALGLPGEIVEVDLLGGLGALHHRGWAHVVHAAADTTYFAHDARAQRRINADVAAAVLRATAPKTFVFLSTAEVAGTRSGRILEAEGDVGQRFTSALQESKLAAELLLRRDAAALGVDLRVVRPVTAVGDTGSAPDAFTRFTRLLPEVAWQPRYARSHLRVPGIKDAPLHLAPVEWLAAAIAALSTAPAAAGGTFHLTTADLTQDQFFTALAERYSFPGLRVAQPRGARPSARTRLEARAHALLARHLDELALHRTFDDRRARQVLDPLGLTPPSLHGPALHRFVDALAG